MQQVLKAGSLLVGHRLVSRHELLDQPGSFLVRAKIHVVPIETGIAPAAAALDRRQLGHSLVDRYITRPAIANERLKRDGAGNVVLQLKSPWRDGTTHIVMTPQEFMQRLLSVSLRMTVRTLNPSPRPSPGGRG